MKRYVKEFANDLLRTANTEESKRIIKILKYYEKCLVTEHEAIRSLLEPENDFE